MKPCWWLEIGPLQEGHYTGISQVTAALAGCMLGDPDRDCRFFYGRAAVAPDIVADALNRRNGELLEWHLARAPAPPAPTDLDRRNIAIFPNRKTCRRDFDIEAQIVHDLSTLLTPQFHSDDTIDYHALSLLDDIASNDISFCVSDATRNDLLRYLAPVDPARVVTAHIAASFDGLTRNLLGDIAAEPYVLVLGTIEPRKNIAQVLDLLASLPSLLARLRFVFLGRFGWGDSIEALLARHGLEQARADGRIVFPGFVSDAAKLLLLEQARLMIYPSLFEGFGLPVLEALAVGTPVLTTRSSSLPEVGGAVCSYFDPFVDGDLRRALAAALQDDPVLRVARQAWAAGFSWQRSWRIITDHLQALADQAPTGHVTRSAG